ncbi:MAG TPA: CRISPR-associated endoribonuclease Cas6 [Candidatus Wirthbacteria bacterium]|nr:CRISPR-associated endoribonuclease Cas6 [Candidatus Wirthbacteria bacterium]
MLYSLVIKLGLQSPVILPPYQGVMVYSAFLAMIQSISPDLADQLHAPNSPKPFTLTQIIGPMQAIKGGVELASEHDYYFRLTVLNRQQFADVLAVLLDRKVTNIRIGEADFLINEVCVTPDQHPYARFESKADLWTRADASQSDIILKFLSPTTFRTGKSNLIFPLPGAVFGSLNRKMALIMQERYKSDLPFDKLLRVARYDSLQTRIFELKRGKQIGFTGTVYYQCLTQDRALTKYLQALASLAFYTGIGAKTTLGMGQAMLLNLIGET